MTVERTARNAALRAPSPARRWARTLAHGAGALRAVARERAGLRCEPRMLTHTVSFRCNARCVMCDSWRIRGPAELTLEQIEGVYRGLPQLDCVRLTGGEPFLRADLPAIAGLAHRLLRPLVLHVTTNGFLTQRIREFCEQRPRELPLHLLVSIDGLAETHDRVRGRERSFARALATLEELAPRRRELGLELAVNQTVTDEQAAREYAPLRAALARLGVRVQLVLAYAESATYSVERERELAPERAEEYASFTPLPRELLESLLEEALADVERMPPLERAAKRYYLRGLRNRALAGRAQPSPPCVALNSHLRLFPNGDVPTCQFNGKIVGNLLRQSFAEVWYGAAARAQRAWVRRCAGCWAECEVLPSATYTADLLRALR
jgi:MoaA/NifB/PqqE/SkfB family radical SAM enzyme